MKTLCFLFTQEERERTAPRFANVQATGIVQTQDHNCSWPAINPYNTKSTTGTEAQGPSALAMTNAGGGDDDQLGGDETKKSERKRQRERQRRYDIANAFDELSSLLSQIDPEDEDSPRSRRRRSSQGDDAPEAIEHPDTNQGHTRLDLIQRSVAALRQLHRENIELKTQLEQRRGSDINKVRMLRFGCGLFRHILFFSLRLSMLGGHACGSDFDSRRRSRCGSSRTWAATTPGEQDVPTNLLPAASNTANDAPFARL